MTTKRKPTRASSPESDFMDHMSSSPEPPEDPLAGVLIGSQSRAAKRGEYVPVPTRSYLASQPSSKTRASNTMPAPAPRPVSRPKPASKPASKSQPPAKPPSRIQSRPPVSKGKGKAKEGIQVIEIIDSEDDKPGPSLPTLPLNPSRRGNVAPARPASTSTTLAVKAQPTTTSRKERPTACPTERRNSAIHDRADSSDDEAEGVALVMVEEGTSAGPSSRALASTAKRRRVEEPVDRELGKVDVEAGAGAPMDVDVNPDLGVHLSVDMDVDAGYQSDATLSYVSDEHETAREEERTSDRRRHTSDEAPGVEEKPFPDFESLRGSKSRVTSTSSSKETPSLSAGASGSWSWRERENTVAGPSNSNPTSASSTSNSSAGSSKLNSNSDIATSPKPSRHAGLFDDSGMSPEDAAAVYAAMFDDNDAPALPPVPASMSVPSATAASPTPVVPDADRGLDEEPRDNGKGKARAEPDPVVDQAAEQTAKAAPVLKWAEWVPLRAICADPTANGSEKQAEDYLERGKGSKLPTMEEHFLRALRAATAVNRDGDVQGKGKAVEEDSVPPYVAYMRRAARAFEQTWDGGGALGDVSIREGDKGKGKEDAMAAAQNAFTFTFPRAAGAPTLPLREHIEESRQQDPQLPKQQQPIAAPQRDPWAFMLAPPMPQGSELVEPQAPPAPVVRAPQLGAGPAAGLDPAGANQARVQHRSITIPSVLAAAAAVPPPLAEPSQRPGAFTFVFPRGAATALQDQARAPGPPVPQVQPQLEPPLQPAPLMPPAGVEQQPSALRAAPAPVQAPPMQAVASLVQAPVPPPAPAAQPVPIAPPAHVQAPVPVPPPAPILTREQRIERAITQIIEILPDIEPGYLLAHVTTYIDAMGDRTTEHVLGILFEADAAREGGYPRVVPEKVWARPPPPPPALPAPRAQVQPQAHEREPQPVPGGSNLGVRARADGGQGPAGQHRIDEPANKKVKVKQVVNYEDINRRSPSEAYRRLSLHYLRLAFPFLPKNIVTIALLQHNNLYAPTYLNLYAAERRYTAFPVRDERPYRCNSTKYNATPERRTLAQVWDEAFGDEWSWVEARQGRSLNIAYSYACLRGSHGAPDHVAAKELAHELGVPAPAPGVGPARIPPPTRVAVPPVPVPVLGEVVPPAVEKGKGKHRAVDVEMAPLVEEQPAEDEGDIECGCCFSNYTFDKMVQCPDTHLFCCDCVSQYAATQLGEHNTSLVCMHSESDCKLPFPESELRRVLTPTLMALYSRLTAQRAVAAAGLEGLEECPFCDWQCVIDAPIEMDRLFRCGNEEGGCGVVSCRECKKKDHLPKTCKEMEEDQVLDGQHAIEEAMTRALMRNCPNPKCKKAFVKETGCNKMTCPHCRTLSCYVCRQIITGYEHFDVMPGAAANTAIAGKCKLWENVEERHANEVRAAAERAAEEIKRDNPEIDHDAIKVDIPVAPPPAPAAAPAGHRAVPAPVVNPQQLLLQQQQAAQLRFQQELMRQRVQEEQRRQRERQAEIVRQERKRQAELRRQRKKREQDARELRRQEARRIRLQQQEDQAQRAALAAAYNAESLAALNSGPLVRALPPAMHPPGPYAPAAPHGADQSNRGQREQ